MKISKNLAGAISPDYRMKQKICPFISTGNQTINCVGLSCYAARKIHFDTGILCICSLLEPEFTGDWVLPQVAPDGVVE